MTNETKELLDAFKDMFNAMEQRNREMINALDEKINSVQQETGNIKALIENTTNKNIQLLMEAYPPITEDIHQLKDDIEVVKFDVDIVKKVVTTHSTELNQLRKAN